MAATSSSMEYLLCPLGDAFLVLKLWPLGQHTLKLREWERNILLAKMTRGNVRGVALISSSWIYNVRICKSWWWEKQHHMLEVDLKHWAHPRGHCLNLTRYCHLPGTITESSKEQSTVLLSQLLHNDDIRPGNTMSRSSLSHSIKFS